MLALTRWKIVLVAVSLLFGLIFTLPNLLPARTVAALPAFMPSQRLNLGLDLQGGSYLLLQVDTNALRKERLTNLTEDIRTKLKGEQIDFTGLAPAGDKIDVRITDPTKVDAAYKLLNTSLGERLLTGGRDITVRNVSDQRIEVAFVSQALDAAAVDAVKRSIEIIRRRIDALGTKEPIITQQGVDRIVVEAPGESDPERLKAVIGKTAKLTFQMVDDAVPPDDLKAGHLPPDDQAVPNDEQNGEPLVVKRRALVTGEMLTQATLSNDENGQPAVAFNFNGPGTQRFARATSENIGPGDQGGDHRRQRHHQRRLHRRFRQQPRHPAQVRRPAGAAKRDGAAHGRGPARGRRGQGRPDLDPAGRGPDLRLHRPGLWPVRRVRRGRPRRQRPDDRRRDESDPGDPHLAGHRRPRPDPGRGRRR
jgi:preprotein translocase subunit SecD